MNTYPTIEGAFYVVTATTETQVTDEHGLALTVAAGKQESFLATGESVNYDGQCHFQQVRNFRVPSAGGGGGGQITIDPAPTQGSENAVSSGGVFTALRELPAPVPEPLGTTTTLLHGHVYTLAVAGNTDLSALGVELYATCELWLDYTAGSVTWPQGLWWAEGSAPTLAAGKSYAIALRNDGVKLRANVQYEDTTPAQS